MASHTKGELRESAKALGRAAMQAGFRPADGMPVAASQSTTDEWDAVPAGTARPARAA
jgi:glycine C-acetyltransferase/8-amino-7-oxononanoate synthase